MVKGQLHGMHSGCGSPFSKNSWVRRECPIRHVLKTDWPLRVFRWWVRDSLTMGAISWSLFSGHSSHVFCHMAVMCLRMIGLKSEGGMRQGCMSVLRAVLAALSARSLPRMPTWPGGQQRWMPKPDALSDVSLEIRGRRTDLWRWQPTGKARKGSCHAVVLVCVMVVWPLTVYQLWRWRFSHTDIRFSKIKFR